MGSVEVTLNCGSRREAQMSRDVALSHRYIAQDGGKGNFFFGGGG